jgi:virginiamycin A acetyltransferase
MLIISESAKISPKADIEPSVKGTKIIIKDRVMIDSFVKIKAVGGMGDLVIGEDSYINSGTVIYTGNGVLIGSNVLIASNCTLAPVNHQFSDKNILIREQGFMASRGGIVIEDDVWIGANTVILDGAYIERGCVIGAHSLVKGRLEAYSIYHGIPVVKVGERK